VSGNIIDSLFSNSDSWIKEDVSSEFDIIYLFSSMNEKVDPWFSSDSITIPSSFSNPSFLANLLL